MTKHIILIFFFSKKANHIHLTCLLIKMWKTFIIMLFYHIYVTFITKDAVYLV